MDYKPRIRSVDPWNAPPMDDSSKTGAGFLALIHPPKSLKNHGDLANFT